MMKKIFTSVCCAAAVLLGAAENEELLYFSFDEGILPDVAAFNNNCVGHVGATENNGGIEGEAVVIKPGLSTGHNGMEIQFRALTLKPGLVHKSDQGAVEFYFAVGNTPEEMKVMVEYTDAKGVKKRKPIVDRVLEICHYDKFSQADTRFSIVYGNLFIPGVSGGSKWRLSFEEVSKKEARVYKGLDWTKNINRNALFVDTGNWKKDEWHHLLFSWDGTKRVLYLDGKKVSESNNTIFNGLVPDAHSTVIGGRAPFQHRHPTTTFKLDELKIHSTPIVPEAKAK